MKNFKRIASVVMVLMMMLSMMLPAMAASITINGAVENETYKAYKIFDATMSDANNTAVAYSITTADEWWEAILDYMVDTGSATPDEAGNYTGNGLTLTSTSGLGLSQPKGSSFFKSSTNARQTSSASRIISAFNDSSKIVGFSSIKASIWRFMFSRSVSRYSFFIVNPHAALCPPKRAKSTSFSFSIL